MWQVQWRHQVHDWKEALHLLADFPEIHQPSHPPGHFSFLPGDSSPTRTHLFSLGPRLREFTKTTSYKNLWNLKKKEKEKKINIISQNQLFLFYVILPHLMKKFHFYLHNIKKPPDFHCQTTGQVYRLFSWIEAGSWQLLQSCNNSFNSPVGFKKFRKPRPVGFINGAASCLIGVSGWRVESNKLYFHPAKLYGTNWGSQAHDDQLEAPYFNDIMTTKVAHGFFKCAFYCSTKKLAEGFRWGRGPSFNFYIYLQ